MMCIQEKSAFRSSRFTETFANRHVILPVIHVRSESQAWDNVQIARDAGTDGAFLINHGVSSSVLLDIHRATHERMPDWWLGVNCLDLHPEEAFQVASADVAGIWVDNAAIDEKNRDQPEANRIDVARQQSGWKGLYFGGVAFKYQRAVEDLAAAATVATRYMDVVTTSGPGTGSAAHPSKIATMNAALGEFPLAIASGITAENVSDYLGAADCFLVATGINTDFDNLDPDKVRALVDRVRTWH